MNALFDPLNILFIVIAAVAGFKLWQVLGQRTGGETPERAPTIATKPLPSDLELKAAPPPERHIWKGYADENSETAKALMAIAEVDPQFDLGEFLRGAQDAHERILNAFASGDGKALRSMLDDAPFAAFESEIERRHKQGEQTTFKFVGIKSAKIVNASLATQSASITVTFVTDLISAMKNASGLIISGDEKRIAEVKELWRFDRNLSVPNQGWRLAETHDQEQ